ncbi:MAG: L,D-transpeptidase [Christensenellales bacterium]|jgi:lipoprotein-anchoring transpeptidase ErfK/SrfK
MNRIALALMGLLLAGTLATGMTPGAAETAADQQANETPAQVAAEPAASTAAPADKADAVAEPTGAPEDGRPWLIRVNLTDMVVSIYAKDAQGEYTRLVKQFIATGGAADTPTPSNVYELKAYRDADHYFVKFDCWAAYATQISGPYLFHSVIFRAPGMQGMNGSYNNLGRAGSHGCIRLTPEEAKWVFDHCPAGTLVDIYHGEANPDLTQSLLPPPSIDGKYPASMPPKVREKRVQPVKIGEYEK